MSKEHKYQEMQIFNFIEELRNSMKKINGEEVFKTVFDAVILKENIDSYSCNLTFPLKTWPT